MTLNAQPKPRVHGVRYQTRNVSRAVAFYTNDLGFTLKHQQGEAFASQSSCSSRHDARSVRLEPDLHAVRLKADTTSS